jgi:S1-C subfamily serine protease
MRLGVCVPILSLASVLWTGCASVTLDKETGKRLHDQLLEKTYFIAEAKSIERVGMTNGQLHFKGSFSKSLSLASATVIAADGYFLTAKHAVDSVQAEPELKPWIIDFHRGQPRVLPAEVIWTSQEGDFALVKADVTVSKPFEWSHPHQKLRRGTPLVQGGLSSHMAAGKVRSDVFLDHAGSDFVVVHHTVKARHGDSGGPLVDREGKLVGINTVRLFLSLDSEGFRFGGGQILRPNIDRLNGIIRDHRQSFLSGNPSR